VTPRWRPLKWFCSVRSEYGLNITSDNYQNEGVRLIRTSDVSEDGVLTSDDNAVYVDPAVASGLLLQNGDLLFSRSGTLGRCLRYIGPPETCTFAAYLVRFRVLPDVDPRYVAYCSRARFFVDQIEADAIQSTISNFNAEKYAAMRLPWHEENEQRAIADYLDTEIARIDALIEKQRRMVELLDERLNSYFVRTVLGNAEGVEQNQSPSGLYGLVPTLWSETSLRHLNCEVQTGPFGSQLHAEDYVDGGWPVVNPMNLIGGAITPTPSMTISDDKRAELSRHILREGDIVFGRRGEMGRAAVVGESEAGWLCGTGSLRLRLVGSYLRPSYLKLLLETSPARAYFELASVGSTMDNLNSEIVLAFPTLVPSLSEQESIVAAVGAMRASVERLRVVLDSQIELGRERRQALITAAVTGALDTPGIAA
jgi:type I restriction enzyme, S subunit